MLRAEVVLHTEPPLDPPPSYTPPAFLEYKDEADVEIDALLKGLDKTQRDELVDAANAKALETTDVYELQLTLSEDEAALHMLWSDPNNWIWGVFYHCPVDPRISVPARNGVTPMCQTLNFANRTPEAKKWRSENRVLRQAYKELLRRPKSGYVVY
ncbi:hypothetical protein BJ742DRAFT_741022 [Cladochytrium replicatum]|nr:hypothetical protein BJ742DRAFT_741022 [Cladochytrium replicatum]